MKKAVTRLEEKLSNANEELATISYVDILNQMKGNNAITCDAVERLNKLLLTQQSEACGPLNEAQQEELRI